MRNKGWYIGGSSVLARVFALPTGRGQARGPPSTAAATPCPYALPLHRDEDKHEAPAAAATTTLVPTLTPSRLLCLFDYGDSEAVGVVIVHCQGKGEEAWVSCYTSIIFKDASGVRVF